MTKLGIFDCPCCDGDGGWTEIVDPELGGPFYTCGYCRGKGRVTFYSWLRWKYYKLRGIA